MDDSRLSMEDKARLRAFRKINAYYADEQGRWWRIRPTASPDCSRWPFTPPRWPEGVHSAWIVPSWEGTHLAEDEEYVGVRGLHYEVQKLDFISVLPARIEIPGTKFLAPAYVLPGHQGANANGLQKEFGLDVVFEWTREEWVIDSRSLGVDRLGWRRSRFTG